MGDLSLHQSIANTILANKTTLFLLANSVKLNFLAISQPIHFPTIEMQTNKKFIQTEFSFGDEQFSIKDWGNLKDVDKSLHEKKFLDILKKHSFETRLIPIPLKGRYTKGRKWAEIEFEACFQAWQEGKSLTLIAATLNRNPQDMIYKLLDRCKEQNLTFTQKGRSISSKNWTSKVKECAQELFEAGLPAWKIAAVFEVDFEHVEKELFVNRKGYGHEKKNPFSINTDHKQYVNELVLNHCDFKITRVLEAFAGEGRFTKILQDIDSVKEIFCIEEDHDTFLKLKSNIKNDQIKMFNNDNLELLSSNILGKFDLIDLDPFVTCHKQIEMVWQHLNDRAYLFVTFGGEYRRSFIKTNRQSIYHRYGFLDNRSDNSEYLEIIPNYFLGFVAKKALENGFIFEVQRAVRYANNCRFWLDVKKREYTKEWELKTIQTDTKGTFFKNLTIPRFKEIRKEIDDARKAGFSR